MAEGGGSKVMYTSVSCHPKDNYQEVRKSSSFFFDILFLNFLRDVLWSSEVYREEVK